MLEIKIKLYEDESGPGKSRFALIGYEEIQSQQKYNITLGQYLLPIDVNKQKKMIELFESVVNFNPNVNNLKIIDTDLDIIPEISKILSKKNIKQIANLNICIDDRFDLSHDCMSKINTFARKYDAKIVWELEQMMYVCPYVARRIGLGDDSYHAIDKCIDCDDLKEKTYDESGKFAELENNSSGQESGEEESEEEGAILDLNNIPLSEQIVKSPPLLKEVDVKLSLNSVTYEVGSNIPVATLGKRSASARDYDDINEYNNLDDCVAKRQCIGMEHDEEPLDQE